MPPRVKEHCDFQTRNGPCGKRPGHHLPPHRSSQAMQRQVKDQNVKAKQWRLDNPEEAKVYSRETAAAWREANREYDRERQHNYPSCRDEIIQKIQEIKLQLGCTDCGYRDHAEALEFDHLDAATKVCGVARMASEHYTWEAITIEMTKCEVVCANCHRVRTTARRR